MSEWLYPLRDDTYFKYLAIRQPSGVYYHRQKKVGKWVKTTLDTRDEAEAKEAYTRVHGKPVPDKRNITCEVAFEQFLANPRRRRKPATIARYKGIWDVHAKHHLATTPVAKVTPEQIIGILDEAETNGSKATGKPLSQSSLRNIYVGLSAFFTSCTKLPTRYRFDNPVSAIGEYIPPFPEARELDDSEYLEDWEIEALALATGDDTAFKLKLKTIIDLSPEFGTRISELLGLVLTDYKALAKPYGELHVWRQLAFKPNPHDPITWWSMLKGRKGTVGDKVRVIGLSPFAKRTLDAYIARGTSEGWLKPGGLLFPNSKGGPMRADIVSHHVAKLGKEKLGRRVTTHYFRHTWASRALEAGFSFEEIAEALGNSPEVARTRYAHRANRVAINARHAAIGRQA